MEPWTVLPTWLATPIVPDDGDGSEPGADPELDVELPGGSEVDSFAEALTRNIDNPVLEQVVERLIQPGVRIVLILLLAVAALWVIRRLIARMVQRAKDPTSPRGTRLRRRIGGAGGAPPAFSLRRAQRADALGALLVSIAAVVVWMLAVFLVLAEFGLNLAPLVAGAGVIGLAIGFGAQNLVADFLSGVFMLAEDQYGVGDIIDVGEAVGTVEGVSLRTTRIRDVEGTLWHVPNGQIQRVGNSSQEWARSLLDIGVAYQTDIDLAIEVIERVAGGMSHEEGYAEQFLAEPSVWGVQNLGPDSVDIRLVIKTSPGTQWGISREMRRRIKTAFDAAGIEIPYPQRTLWMRRDDEKSSVGVDPDQDRARVERAIAIAGQGDRGPDHAARQDDAAVAEDVEEDLAAQVDAEPAGGTDPADDDRPSTRP